MIIGHLPSGYILGRVLRVGTLIGVIGIATLSFKGRRYG